THHFTVPPEPPSSWCVNQRDRKSRCHSNLRGEGMMRYIALVTLAAALMLPAPVARADNLAPLMPSDANVQAGKAFSSSDIGVAAPVIIADRSNDNVNIVVGFAGGLAVGFAVAYAVRGAVSLRRRQTAMKRTATPLL